MERRFFLLAASVWLLPGLAVAQPGSRDENRPGGSGNRPGRPGGGLGRPAQPPPITEIRPGPQFSWQGHFHDRYHAPAFRYPRGYAYRSWAIGSLLPALFLNTAYYWDNWRALGVGRPPPGRRWVRYGPDLLLVNVRTRRIEDVIRGAFY